MTLIKHLIVFSMPLFAFCSSPDQIDIQEKKAVTDEVHKTLQSYYRDIKREGLTAEFKYLDSSDEFFWVPPGYSGAISYDSIVRILQKTAPMIKSVENVFDTLSIIPLSKTFVSYTARISSRVTDTSGKTQQLTLLETGVMVKRKSGWKLLNGQTGVVLSSVQ